MKKISLKKFRHRASLFFPNILFVALDRQYKLYIYTNNKQLRYLDLKKFIKKKRDFKPLKDLEVFKKHLKILDNTIAWDLNGTNNEKEFLKLDPCILFDAPIIEKSIEDLLFLKKHKIKKPRS